MTSSIWTAGKDASANAPSLAGLTKLSGFKISAPGNYFVQNQSANQLVLKMYDPDNNADTPSYYVIDAGAGAGSQGGSSDPAIKFFTGQIDVYGQAGSQFMARYR